jgi:transcription factor CP2 and related proteins
MFHRALTPRLTMYVSFDGTMYHAIYLDCITLKELTQKLYKLPGFVDCINAATNNSNRGGGPVSPINETHNDNSTLFPTNWDQSQMQDKFNTTNNNNNTYDTATVGAAGTANNNLNNLNNNNNSNSLTMFIYGPNGIHVLVTDEVLINVKDESLFALEMHNGKLLMKAVKAADL